jgi:hypothetical protein
LAVSTVVDTKARYLPLAHTLCAPPQGPRRSGSRTLGVGSGMYGGRKGGGTEGCRGVWAWGCRV